MNYIVYKTTNLINDYIYIGVHKTNPTIFDGYIGNGITGEIKEKPVIPTKFKMAVYKYGYKNFKRETLAVFPDSVQGEQEAYSLEAKLVNAKFLRRKNVYNMTLGGKINGFIAKKKPVYQFDLQGNLLKVWKSAIAASESFKNPIAARSSICNVCNKITRQAYGYYWSYKKLFAYDEYLWTKAVARYDDAGNFLESYSSIKEAAKELHIKNATNISHAISGQQKRCGGFRWRLFYGNTQNIKPLT